MNRPARARKAHFFTNLIPLLTLMAFTAPARGQEIILTLTTPNHSVAGATTISLWLNALNPTSTNGTWTFPPKNAARIVSNTMTNDCWLELRAPADAGAVTIAPGAFARREYQLTLPTTARGPSSVDLVGWDVSRLALDLQPPPSGAAGQASTTNTWLDRFLKDAEPLEPGKPFDAGRFFKEHISPHEPMYFIVGTESPNAKFQISFKYQLLRERSEFVTNHPALKGFHVAYTQVSLWDLSAPSAPFFDTSYKPAFLYSQESVVGGQTADRLRLDLMAAAQHESNGKSGGDSRSLNTIFFRPTFILGRDDQLQLVLQPRAWAYVGDLDDNPDLKNYRGYFDLRTVVGWRRGLQLSAYGRLGKDGNNGSLQLDLTYPTMRFLDSFSVYLHAQYFTGYGESLLLYNQRSDAFRLGFALYR